MATERPVILESHGVCDRDRAGCNYDA